MNEDRDYPEIELVIEEAEEGTAVQDYYRREQLMQESFQETQLFFQNSLHDLAEEMEHIYSQKLERLKEQARHFQIDLYTQKIASENLNPFPDPDLEGKYQQKLEARLSSYTPPQPKTSRLRQVSDVNRSPEGAQIVQNPFAPQEYIFDDEITDKITTDDVRKILETNDDIPEG